MAGKGGRAARRGSMGWGTRHGARACRPAWGAERVLLRPAGEEDDVGSVRAGASEGEGSRRSRSCRSTGVFAPPVCWFVCALFFFLFRSCPRDGDIFHVGPSGNV